MGARKPKAQGKKQVTDFLDQITEFFLCGRWPDVRISKKRRPYFVCAACGMQVFVRGDSGIERLKERVREEL